MPPKYGKAKPKRKYGAKRKYGKQSGFRKVDAYRVPAQPFPTKLHTRCVFADVRYCSTLSASSSISNQQVYRLNSIQDPDLTGGGTTVRGWAALNTLYEKYIVTGCKVDVTFEQPSVEGVISYCSLAQRSGTDALTQKQLIDIPLTYLKPVPKTGSQKAVYSMFVKPWAMQGISRLEYMTNSDKYAALMSTYPAVDVVLRVGTVGNNTGLTTDTTTTVSVKLTYYVTFYNRNGLTTTSS